MPDPRNLNYVLGSVGKALESLSAQWKEEVPPIQNLVINKQTGLPGEGGGWFMTKKGDFRKLPRKLQALVQAKLQNIFAYPKWLTVLEAFGLSAKLDNYTNVLSRAVSFRGGGEGLQHRRLKEYVAAHPKVVQLPAAAGVGKAEFPLPSGDSLDVLFQVGDDWHTVEVTSAISRTNDIVRGMFQYVEYRGAVAEAYQATQGLPQSVRTIRVLEDALPVELVPMEHMPGIEIIDCVQPQ